MHAGQAVRICREQDFGLMLAWCSAVDGWAEAARGDAGGILRVRAAIEAARAAGSDQFLPHMLATLAEACLLTGRVREGREAIEEGVDAVARSGERFSLSDLHRLRAECLLANGEDVRAAEAAFDEAIEVARDQRARLLVLRALVGLARLRMRAGALDSIRQPIIDARAAIVEGDALPDVIEAEHLLAAG